MAVVPVGAKSRFWLICRECGNEVAAVNYGCCTTCMPVEPCSPDDPNRIKFSAYIAGVDTR